MSYRFEPGQIYRMPTHFGPAPGPRQLPDGIEANHRESPRRLSVAASFLTDADRLQRHLPDGFALAGEPVVSVEVHYMSDVDWLAGRGYTMIHVGWPAAFAGRQRSAAGRFLAVVWENLADPIISGRDEIGHPKLYAAIDAPRQWNGVQYCAAGWMGFRFLELEVWALRDAGAGAPAVSDGTLMLKYLPVTGDWGKAALCQVTLTPASDPDRTVQRRQTGEARIRFHPAAWSDLPTMSHVVNALADLPIRAMLGGSVTASRGGKPYRDQQILL